MPYILMFRYIFYNLYFLNIFLKFFNQFVVLFWTCKWGLLLFFLTPYCLHPYTNCFFRGNPKIREIYFNYTYFLLYYYSITLTVFKSGTIVLPASFFFSIMFPVYSMNSLSSSCHCCSNDL